MLEGNSFTSLNCDVLTTYYPFLNYHHYYTTVYGLLYTHHSANINSSVPSLSHHCHINLTITTTTSIPHYRQHHPRITTLTQHPGTHRFQIIFLKFRNKTPMLKNGWFVCCVEISKPMKNMCHTSLRAHTQHIYTYLLFCNPYRP